MSKDKKKIFRFHIEGDWDIKAKDLDHAKYLAEHLLSTTVRIDNRKILSIKEVKEGGERSE